ncbi:MAG: [NiFe]-hydrogenase assembly chaperone HybE [Solirubrobacterales bacterium]
MTVSAADQDRIDRMCAVFTQIGEERMKDLSLYNDAIRVEAIGFRRWEGWLTGILITPWFMNFMLMPTAPEQMDGAQVSTKRRVEMPRGEVVFTIGEVEQVGPYMASSLHSPMGNFKDHAQAATAAWAAVEQFFQPPPEQTGPCRGV